MKLKHAFITWVFRHAWMVDYGLDLLESIMRASRFPLLRHLHPFTNRRNNYIVNLPVHEKITTESTPLPPAVLTELIQRSHYHTVLDFCMCRHGRGCSRYPHGIGCLFLGETGLDVPPPLSRRITAEEALTHATRAIQQGLVPMVVRARVDNYAFLLRDRHKLIGVCFCCDCCCTISTYRHVPLERLEQIFPRLDGLDISVTENCVGCGICMHTCYMHAISIQAGRAVHSELCRGCGRCATTCPHGAVAMTLPDHKQLKKTIDTFLSIADIGS